MSNNVLAWIDKSDSTITWILNVDYVEHRRSFDGNMAQILKFRRQHGSNFEVFDDKTDRNLIFRGLH